MKIVLDISVEDWARKESFDVKLCVEGLSAVLDCVDGVTTLVTCEDGERD